MKSRTLSLYAAVGTLALSLFVAVGSLAGCAGMTTDLDVCNAYCDQEYKCGLLNDVQTANCHTDCQNNSGTHAQNDMNLATMCSNVGAIRDAQIQCLNTCNVATIAGCEVNVALTDCLKKPAN